MFHTYVYATVLAADGRPKKVDIDRATFLMDKDLYAAALYAMGVARRAGQLADSDNGAQFVWDDYCRRHLDKYGQPFNPDIDPDWDS